MLKNFPLSVVFFLLLFSACKKDPTSPDNTPQTPSATGVYILNEGNFGQNNSSLSYYDIKNKTVANDVFSTVNSRPLGDIANAMVIRNNTGYIVVNNSDKIEIIDTRNHQSLGTINAGAGKNPRRLAFINDSLVLVSNFYDSSVSLINVLQKTIVQRIPVGLNPDGIAVKNNRAYIANSGLGYGNTMSIINLATMMTAQTFHIGDNPVLVQTDSDGEVYILCAGFDNDLSDTPGKIYVYRPATESVVDSIFIGGHPFAMCISQSGIGYVVSEQKIVKLNTTTNTSIGKFIDGTFYNVGVDETTGEVYCTDAKNFSAPGEVSIYSSTTQFKKKFTVGIIPGAMAFK